MILYRVEQSEYDYSPTLGVFSSLEKAEDHLKGLGAKFSRKYESWWKGGTESHAQDTFVIYKLELDIPGESGIRT